MVRLLPAASVLSLCLKSYDDGFCPFSVLLGELMRGIWERGFNSANYKFAS